VGIERFIWTDHADLRLGQRGLARIEVEDVIREGHENRESNQGDAAWRLEGVRADGRKFVVIYDNPALGDEGAARVVSVWPLRGSGRN
jgi:hypothetical protein